jgi:hypothetical protein
MDNDSGMISMDMSMAEDVFAVLKKNFLIEESVRALFVFNNTEVIQSEPLKLRISKQCSFVNSKESGWEVHPLNPEASDNPDEAIIQQVNKKLLELKREMISKNNHRQDWNENSIVVLVCSANEGHGAAVVSEVRSALSAYFEDIEHFEHDELGKQQATSQLTEMGEDGVSVTVVRCDDRSRLAALANDGIDPAERLERVFELVRFETKEELELPDAE